MLVSEDTTTSTLTHLSIWFQSWHELSQVWVGLILVILYPYIHVFIFIYLFIYTSVNKSFYYVNKFYFAAYPPPNHQKAASTKWQFYKRKIFPALVKWSKKHHVMRNILTAELKDIMEWHALNGLMLISPVWILNLIRSQLVCCLS